MVTYGVVGAGRQGTATAYDIARFSPESCIELADSDPQAARLAADRINSLLDESRVVPRCLQVEQPEEIRPFLKGLDVCASAAPYRLNLTLAREAVASGVSFCDLGGNADIVEQELDLDLQALENGISIVPDCGVGPGMISNLALLAFEQFDQAEEILIYDGGLPQDPQPPFHYRCFFNLEGLTNEYDGEALYLDKGQVVRVPCFAEEEFEQVEVPELGELEAFTTSGGLTTLASTLEGKVLTLKNKTLRYPGHYALFKGLRDLGLLGCGTAETGLRESCSKRPAAQTPGRSYFAPSRGTGSHGDSCAGCGPAGRFPQGGAGGRTGSIRFSHRLRGHGTNHRLSHGHRGSIAGTGECPGRRNSPGTGRHSGGNGPRAGEARHSSEDVLDLIGHFTQLAYSSPVGTSSASAKAT